MLQLNETNFENETRSGVVLVDFYADWCGPCRALSPVLETLQNVKIGKVNIDEERELAMRFQVSSIPTLVFMKGGVEVNRVVGLRTQAQLQQTVDDLNGSNESAE